MKEVYLPDKKMSIEFPDSMSDDDISYAIRTSVYDESRLSIGAEKVMGKLGSLNLGAGEDALYTGEPISLPTPKNRPAAAPKDNRITTIGPEPTYQPGPAPNRGTNIHAEENPQGPAGKIFDFFTRANQKERTARAQNVLAIAKDQGLNPSVVSENYDQITKQLGIRRDQTTPEFIEMLSALPIAGGLAAAPIKAGLSLAAYMGLAEAESFILSKAQNKEYQALHQRGLSSLLPEESGQITKDLVEIFDIGAKGALIGAAHKGGPALFEKFTKDMTEHYDLPKDVFISPEKVKDIFQTGEKISPQEMSLYKDLDLTPADIKAAMKQGLDIKIPVTKLSRVADKPYWAKLKEIIGIKPYEETTKTMAGEVAQNPKALEYKPEDVIVDEVGKEMQRGQELAAETSLIMPKAEMPLTTIPPEAITPQVGEAVKAVGEEQPIIETDPARVQEIKNSIAEGETILRFGRSTGGKKYTPEYLESIQKSVNNSKAKLGITEDQPAPESKFGGKTVDIKNYAKEKYPISPKKMNVLGMIERELLNGSPGKRRMDPDTKEWTGYGSTYPPYFQGLGYTQKESLTALKKAMDGAILTPPQRELVEILMEGKRQEILKEVLEIREAERQARQEVIDAAKANNPNITRREIEERYTQAQGYEEAAAPGNAESGRLISGRRYTEEQFNQALDQDKFPWEVEDTPSSASAKASSGTFADIGSGEYSEGPQGSTYQDSPSVMQLPEIVELARELMGGKYPRVLQRLSIRSANGLFRPSSGKIEILAGIAEDPVQLAKTLAHEIGHLIDWLPDQDIRRGNILGRIASMKKFMKGYIAGFPGGPGAITEAEDAFLHELAKQMKKGPQFAEEWIDEIIRKELPITPDDVLAIWNSTMENRQNINKDLEDYIKRLSTAEKKAIVKEALSGRIHRDITRFHRVEETKTGNKIKRTVQINPDDRSIKKLYQKLLDEEIKKRRLLEAKAVTNELKQFTMAWKPFDPTANKKYTKYRFSSVELYADALSAMITNPAYLRAKAPLFYEGWFNYLENKPEVKREYEALQDDIRSGQIEKNRVIRLREGFGVKEDEYVRGLVENRKKNPIAQKDAWGNAFIDRSYAILRRVKLTGESNVPDRFNPRYAIEDMLYSGSETEGYLADMYNEVLKPAENHNINPTDLGEYMFHWRVATERSKLANPQGWTPELSMKRIREMDESFGPRLKELKDRFYRIRKSYFVDKALDSKMFSPELEKVFEDNENYATFDIVGHFEKSYGREGTAKIFRQIGTFSPTGNPLTATLMKDMHLIYAINRNNAAKSVTRFMQEFHPAEIQPAEKKWGGKFMESIPPKDPAQGQITLMEGGKMQAFNVPKYVAETFEKNPIEGMVLAQILRATAKPFKAVFTEFNPGFWLFNIMRDYRKAVRAIPGAGYMNFAKYFLQGVNPAFRSVFGRPDQLAQEMRRGRMFISMGDYRGQSPEDTQLERLLKKYNMIPTAWNNKILRPLGAFLDNVSKAGQAIERIPKMGGYLFLKDKHLAEGMSKHKLAHEIRANIGSPAFLRRGSAAPIYNNLLLFSNAIKEGWRSDVETTTRNKADASWKFAKYYLLPKLMMFAAGAGLFGLGIKSLMDRVSEYDKANYSCYPIGMTPGGKAVYLRLPADEGGRFLGGVTWKVLRHDRDKFFTGMFDYMAGQAPTAHPFLTMLGAVVQYASGQNPYDHFRGREAIPETEFKADDYRSKLAFGSWLSNQLGGGIVYRFGSDRPGEIKTELEQVLGMPIVSNTVGRFVKVSDYGIKEELQKEKKNIQKEMARETLDTKDAMTKLMNGEKLDDKEILLIASHHQMVDNYMKTFLSYQYGNVYLQEYMSAASKKEKAAVLKRMLQDLPNGLVAEDRPPILNEAEAKGEK